ncbi:MAG: LVIVD repeat-containing protein [Xanthobacteraceae bacterium]
MQARIPVAGATLASLLLASSALAQAPKIGGPPEAKNMRLAGYNDLQARSAYQPVIHKQGSRYIAYVGHHGGTEAVPKPVNSLTGQAEFNGTSIVDVTDPSKPTYLAHIPGVEGLGEQGGGQMVRACDGKTLPKGDPDKTYLLRTFGGLGHEIWDVSNPAAPKLLTRISWNLKDTHKSWWECDTGIAYLVSGRPDWRTRRMTEVYDLSDPTKPVKIRDFGLPGQQPGATGAVPTELHGMISTGPSGNRVYFGYGTNKGGVMQIVDREKLLNGPKEPTPENLRYPVIGQLDMLPLQGAHSVIPLGKMKIAEFAKDLAGGERDMIMIVDEGLVNECQAAETRQMAWFVDATVESRPMVVSNFNVPEASGNFCSRGGRFGSHSGNESAAPVFHQKVAVVTWFNAGVRAIDIRDPYRPQEIGYFIPPITEATSQRCIKVDGRDRCKTAIQSNNVETDDRGYIYVVDRANTGMHILELTGEARTVAGQQ